MSHDAMHKAMHAALQVAQQRLLCCSAALEKAVRPDGVLLSAKVPGRWHVVARLLWPGVLQELDTRTGEVLASTPAVDMFDLRPQAAALLSAQAKGRPALHIECVTPQGSVLLAAMDAAGIVYVRSKRTKELLAISEAGEPTKLRADFQPLKPEDLKPVLR